MNRAHGDDPFGWAQSETLLYCAAYVGLSRGNLAPLAAYLRANLPLTFDLSDLLASAIDGLPPASDLTSPPDFRLVIKRQRGWRSRDEKRNLHLDRLEVGFYLHTMLSRVEKGGFESAVLETMQRYSRSRSVVTDCLSYYRSLFLDQGGECGNIDDLLAVIDRSPDQ